MDINEIIIKLKKYDKAYALGKPLVTDEQYDKLREKAFKLDPKNAYFKLLSTRDAAGKDIKLPTPMPSLSKERPSSIVSWARFDTEYLITPKLDGLACKVQYKKGKLYKAYTRGDGITGRDVTAHAHYINGIPLVIADKANVEINGEVIIHKHVFEQLKTKYRNVKGVVQYKASRNFVVGMLNTKDPKPEFLENITFVVYSLDSDTQYKHKLDYLNYAAKHGFITVCNLGRWDKNTCTEYKNKITPKYPTIIDSVELGKFLYAQKEITEKLCSYLLNHWREIVAIDTDGIVIEVADIKLRKKLGIDDTPKYAKAIKPDIKDHHTQKCTVSHLEWQISSRGLYKVTIVLKTPIMFNGVAVQRCTGFNAKAIEQVQGLGAGSIIEVIRSGEVIPRWVNTVKAIPAPLPKKCVHCKTPLQWTNSHTDLWCSNTSCVGFAAERVIQFFHKFKIDTLSEKTIAKLQNLGYNTVPKILNIDENTLANIDGLGKKSAHTIITNMHAKLNKVSLAELMHASSMFSDENSGLGKKRAQLIIDKIGEKGVLDKPIDATLHKTLAVEIDGIAETLAAQFVENLPAFREFYRELPIGALQKQVKGTGKIAIWSGYRSKEEEEAWQKKGGSVTESMTKAVNVLFTSTPGSTKTVKAQRYGIKIIGKADAMKYINSV